MNLVRHSLFVASGNLKTSLPQRSFLHRLLRRGSPAPPLTSQAGRSCCDHREHVSVRAVLIRQPTLIVITVVAFLGILVAWLSRARFVATMANGASMTMAVATAASILCYALILFIDPGATTDEGVR